LKEEFPDVRIIPALGLGYDGAKRKAAAEASGRFVLFLVGDCIPQPGWHHHLLEVLRSGRAVACGGFTRYEGGLLASIASVMDFGFLYPRVSRSLECYAFNNCGFTRESLSQVPIQQLAIRCSCYFVFLSFPSCDCLMWPEWRAQSSAARQKAAGVVGS